jgi:hypothetical protein
MPTDLLDRAAAKNRRRAARNRLIGATSAVAVAAVAAALIVSVPGQSTGRQAARVAQPRVQTAAYVLQRAAAAEVNSYRLVSVSDSPGSGTLYTDISLQRQRTVASVRDSAGQPYFQIVDAINDNVWTDTVIDNQDHVYSVQTASTKASGIAEGLTISSFLPLQSQSNPAAAFQAALKAGTITVVGHQKLGGRDAILIRVKRLTKPERAAAGYPSNARPVPANEIWIDASTYLLIQTKTYEPDGSSFITRVSWLPATSANLAKLTATPPSGYARVPYSEMAHYLAPIS